jgi:hypothetical protein
MASPDVGFVPLLTSTCLTTAFTLVLLIILHSPFPLHPQILVATPAVGSVPPRLRSRCFINGCPVTLRALRALNGLLVDMNGQHSSLALADPGIQMALLDRVAACGALKVEVGTIGGGVLFVCVYVHVE